MAHLVTGYAGFEHIKSEDDGAFNAAFFGDGQYVMEFGNQFSASIIDNNTIRILDGEGLMFGRHFRIPKNNYEDIPIKTGTAGVNRTDLICMVYRKNENDRTESVAFEVIESEEATTAPMPEYTEGNILNGAIFNQMPFFKVTIEGVVLKSVEPLFETIPTYQALAEKYAKLFQAKVNEYSSEVTAAQTAAENAQKTADGKSDSGHKHTKSEITDFPSSLKNPSALTVQFNGTTNQTYDGSSAKTLDITKSAIGLGNVPNVATNDQTPTYSDTTTLATLSSGEKLNVALQKIKCAITNLINHLANTSNPHSVTKAQVGLANVTNNTQMPIAGGTFTGNAKAYETARTTRGIFNEETRASSTTGTLQSVKYFIDVT